MLVSPIRAVYGEGYWGTRDDVAERATRAARQVNEGVRFFGVTRRAAEFGEHACASMSYIRTAGLRLGADGPTSERNVVSGTETFEKTARCRLDAP